MCVCVYMDPPKAPQIHASARTAFLTGGDPGDAARGLYAPCSAR